MKRATWTTLVSIATTAAVTVGCTGPVQQTVQQSQSHRYGSDSSTGSRRPAGPDASEASRRCADLLPLMEQVARETDLDLALLVGIVRTESNFRNDVKSAVGALGLTQCMPATAKAKKCGPLSDPYENLKCGARVIKAFLNYYNNSVYLGLSGYNAGHGMPNRAKKQKELPTNVEYVEKVLQAASRFESRGCDF